MSVVSGTVLVTGATGGIGHAIARAFAARGAQLILTGRRADLLEGLAEEVGGRAIACDLSVRADVERLITEAGEVDVLVANAGLPASGQLSELTPAQVDAMLEVNLRAPIRLAQALAAPMIGRRRGHLAFVSSLSGKAVASDSSIYSATKFGLRGFALALREDLRRDGVGVSVVLPGFVRDAGMFADAHVELPAWIGTSTPQQVAAATVRSVERNQAEVSIAPVLLRVGASLASVAPAPAAAMARWTRGDRIARAVARNQVDKRPSG